MDDQIRSSFALGIAIAALNIAGCNRSTPSQEAPPAKALATVSSAPVSANSAAPSAPAMATASALPAPGGPSAADSTDAARLKKYWAAMGQGRMASVKKQYSDALLAFGRALDVLPDDARAYAERGYAQLLAKNYALARDDFDRAALRTGDSKLLAQIWFNYGLTAEQEGHPDDARSAFARSNELNPTNAAAAKLEGGSTCTARVSERKDIERTSRAPLPKGGGDFLAAFQQLLAGRTADRTPSTVDEARSLLCATGDCAVTPGNGAPLRLKVGDETLYGAVIGLPDNGMRIFSNLTVAKSSHCGNSDTITIRHQQPFQFHVERAQQVERFEGPAQSECTEANSALCTRRCVSSTTLVQDFLFNAAGSASRLLVEQWKTPGGRTPWEVSVTGTDGRILGSGCDIIWDLK